jgi:hypothetical protein
VIYFSDFSGGDVITLVGASVSALDFSPNDVAAAYRLTSGGLEQSGVGNPAGPFYTTIGNWVTPTGNAGLYEVRATVNSGVVSTGTTGSWLPLTATRTWTVERFSVGVSSANLTIQVRRTGDTTVLASANVDLFAEVA